MSYFYANPNPKKKLVIDCVIRAICIVTNKSWHEVFFDICTEAGVQCDMPSSNQVWKSYLLDQGFKIKMIPDMCPACYTVAEFSKDNPNGKFIVCTGEHAVAVMDGNYYDTWDSGDEVPIYFYYKENE